MSSPSGESSPIMVSSSAIMPSPSAVTSSTASGIPPSSVLTSSTAAATSPVSPAPPPPLSEAPVRLWVGNIQSYVAEYQLLRLARPLGTITRFDFMLHGAGPLAGRPRGYAFLSYSSHQQADQARLRLSGAPLGGARLVCRWAHEQTLPGEQKKEELVAALSGVRKVSAETKIRAIEAKLMNMSGREQQFDVSSDNVDSSNVRRLPKVRGPLSWVNAPAKQPAHQAKPYARNKW